MALVVVMGLGVASWHPEGYKTATGVAGDRKATALSWFSLGGNVGLALGPPVITSLVTGLALWWIGLPNPTLWAVVVGVLNFVPYIGPLIIIALLGLAGAFTFADSAAHCAGVP